MATEFPHAAAVADRPRGFVALSGPDAEAFLQRMVSNDVTALRAGESCEALLLTPKGRVIAPLVVARRADDDFLVLTEPELADVVRTQLVRARFAAKVAIEVEEHRSYVVLGPEAATEADELTLVNRDYGVRAVEVVGGSPPDGLPRVSDDELEVLRIEAASPRFGRELDDRVLPAEAGLVERAVSFTKGCYPGQEPIARLHYRGHANRSLRVLELHGDGLPEDEAEVRHGERAVGRVTSAARRPDGTVVALAYVRLDVPDDAELAVGETIATPLHFAATRP